MNTEEQGRDLPAIITKRQRQLTGFIGEDDVQCEDIAYRAVCRSLARDRRLSVVRSLGIF